MLYQALKSVVDSEVGTPGLMIMRQNECSSGGYSLRGGLWLQHQAACRSFTVTAWSKLFVKMESRTKLASAVHVTGIF